MKKFWNFIRNDAGERVLRLEGPIDEDNFWGDEITPDAFRDELEAEEGDVTVWICSPGGNVFAAAQIYSMLRDHKGRITVKIDSIAASAASVVAMAGDKVLMSPVAMLMIHDPMTIAMGNKKDMEKAIDTLNEVKESIINAYQTKSGLSRKKIGQLMEDETWMNAKKAVELGFADGILFAESENSESEGEDSDETEIEAVWQPYSTKAMGQRVLNWLLPSCEAAAGADEEPVKAESDPQDVEPPEAGVTNEEASPFPPKEKPKEDDPGEEDGEAESEEEEAEGEDDPEEEKEPAKEPKKPKAELPPDEEAKDEKPSAPVIGLDGRAPDGAMPYEILKKQLEFLK